MPKTTPSERLTARLAGCCHAASMKSSDAIRPRRGTQGLRGGVPVMIGIVSGREPRDQPPDSDDDYNNDSQHEFYALKPAFVDLHCGAS